MVQFGYAEQKMFLFGAVGILPLTGFMLSTLLGFPMMGALMIGALVWVASVIAGHILTSQNAWVKSVQSGEPIVIDTNSTGVGKSFNIEVSSNVFNGGKDIILPDGTRMAYDRAITHLIASPQKGVMTRINQVGADGKEIPYLVTFMPVEEYKSKIWNIDNKTFLFFDSLAGTFLTKPLLGVTEKELMSDYITLNELREIRELTKVMREFTRYTFDLIASKFGQLLKSPLVIIVVVIIILAVLGYGAIQMLPSLAPHATAVATPIAEPLTKGAGAVVSSVTGLK